MMGRKIRVNLYLDEAVVKEAKELGLNLSKYCENALRTAIRKLKELNIKEESIHQDNLSKNSELNNCGGNSWCGARDLNPGNRLGRPAS